MSGILGAFGPPDVLPMGYGEYTSGEFGRLMEMDPSLDTSVTTQWPYRTYDNSHGLKRGDPNFPAYAATVPSLDTGVAPLHAVSMSESPLASLENGDLGRLSREERKARRQQWLSRGLDTGSRDVAGANGYQYRQYSNGDIEVLEGSPAMVGTRLTSTGPQAQMWEAVTAEIGAYETAQVNVGRLREAWEQLRERFQDKKAAGVPMSTPNGSQGPGAVVALGPMGRGLGPGRVTQAVIGPPPPRPFAPKAKAEMSPWLLPAVGTVVVGSALLLLRRQQRRKK